MNGPRGITRRPSFRSVLPAPSAAVVGFAGALLLFPPAAPAQEGGPLLKSDLVRMMTASNHTPTEMAAIVRMNCIGFEPTARDRNQLGDLPNADVVMAEVERCASRPVNNSADQGSETADEVEEAEPADVQRAPPPPRRRDIDLGNMRLAAADASTPTLQRPRSRGTAATAATAGASEQPAPRGNTSDLDSPPRLTNWQEVSSAFLREYRPNVRQPGTVLLWLRVGPEGRVVESRVKRNSGDPVMADAALSVADVMRFEPAIRNDRPVESWTELPINFSSR